MADTLDVVTLEEAKAMLDVGVLDTSKNANLERLVTTVSRRLDKLVGPIVQRTVTDEPHNGGNSEIELRFGPCSAITSVTEYQGETATVLTEEVAGTIPDDGYLGDTYLLDPSLYSGVLIRRSGGRDSFFYPGRRNIIVSYTAGRYDNTAAVDSRFKEAAAIMLHNFWRSYNESTALVGEFEVPTQNFPRFAVPQAVLDLLHDEIQPEIGFGA